MSRAGTTLKMLRRQRGLTQEDVADLFHTTQQRISAIESGRLQIKADDYFDMIELLSVVEKKSFVLDWPRKQLTGVGR